MMHETELDKIIKSCRASQDPDELRFVYHEVEQINPKVIVEIGTWKGYFLETLDKMFAPSTLIGVESDPLVIDPDMDNEYLILTCDSNDPASLELMKKELNGQRIDYLFIDADHKYESVKKDFELYAPLVRDGGIIGFHDISLDGLNADGHSWWDIGLQVKKYWEEITKLYPHKSLQGSKLGTGTGLIYV